MASTFLLDLMNFCSGPVELVSVTVERGLTWVLETSSVEDLPLLLITYWYQNVIMTANFYINVSAYQFIKHTSLPGSSNITVTIVSTDKQCIIS